MKERNEILLDMITSGYVSICKKDQEIEKLKYEISVLTQANETLHNNFKEIENKARELGYVG